MSIKNSAISGMVIGILLLIGLANVTVAQEQKGLALGNAAGMDDVVGSVGTIYEQYTYEGKWEEDIETWISESIDNYGWGLKAIKVEPKFKFIPKLQIGLGRKEGCTLSFGGWGINGYGAVSGQVSGMGLEQESQWEEIQDTYTYTYNLSLPVVTLWGEPFYSYSIDEVVDATGQWWWILEQSADPDAVSTMYDASRDVSLGSYHLDIETGGSGIKLTGGVRSADVLFDDTQHVNGEFKRHYIYLYDYEGDYKDKNWYEWVEGNYYNNYDLRVDSRVRTNGFGPSVGVSAKCRFFAIFGADIAVSRSWILGMVNRKARFVDIDDGSQASHWYWDEDYDGQVDYEWQSKGTFYLEGDFPFEQNCTTIMPITEGQVGLSLFIGPLTLTVGYFYSLWQDVPMPAVLYYPDELANNFWLWKTDIKRDIMVSGPKVKLELKF